MKYTRKMSIGTTSNKPLFSWAELLKDADKPTDNTLFGGRKPSGFKWSTNTKAKRERDAKAKYEAELALAKQRQKEQDKGFQWHDVTDVAGNAIDNARDIVSGMVKLPLQAAGAVKDNGLHQEKSLLGLANFGKEVAKTTYDAYDELGPIKDFGQSLGRAKDSFARGDIKGGLFDALDSFTQIGEIRDPKRESNPTDFGKFADQLQADPLFYALDVVPGAGSALKEAGVTAKVVDATAAGRATRNFLESRANVKDFAKQHYANTFTEANEANAYKRAVDKLTADEAAVVFQVAHGMSFAEDLGARAKAVLRDADMENGVGKVTDDEVLKRLVADNPNLENTYHKAAKHMEQLQEIETQYKEGYLTKVERDAAVNQVKANITDKSLKRIVDALDRNSVAAAKNAKHFGIPDLAQLVRAYRPMMSLYGYRDFKTVRSASGDRTVLVASGRHAIGVATRIPGEKSKWEILYKDNKGHVKSRREESTAWVKKNLVTQAKAQEKFYGQMIRNLNLVRGSKLKPTYMHHTDGMDIGTATLAGSYASATSGAKTSRGVLYDTGRVNRVESVFETAKVYAQGVRNAMAREVLSAFISDGKLGKFRGRIDIVTDARTLPDSSSGRVILHAGSQEFDGIKNIIMSHKQVIEDFNTHAKAGLKIPNDASEIRAIVVDKQTLNYVRSMLGLQKDVGTITKAVTSVWKLSVLAFRPAFIVNNFIGNEVMGIMRDPAILREQMRLMWSRTKGGKTLAKDLKYDEKMIQEHFAEGLAGFGKNERVSSWVMKEANKARYDALPGAKKALFQAEKAMNFAFTVVEAHENLMRGSLIRTTLKRDPEIQRLMKADKLPDVVEQGKLTRAFEHLLVEDTKYAESLQKATLSKVENVMGNYHYFTPTEQRVKQIFPFYSWYRHIYKYALQDMKAGGKAIGASATGRLNELYPELASYPEWVSNFIPFDVTLPGNEAADGRDRYLDLSGLNPFATIPEVFGAIEGLTVGQNPGDYTSLLSMVNPVLTAPVEALTGKNIRTGGTIENTWGVGLIGSTMQRLVESNPVYETFVKRGILHGYDSGVDMNDESTYLTPSGEVSKAGVKPTAYSKSFANAFYRWLGVPVQDIDSDALTALGDKIRSAEQKSKYYFTLPKPPKTSEERKQAKEANSRTILSKYLEENNG